MDADGTLATTAVAAQLHLGSARKFNERLHERGVIRRIGNKWVPTAAYVNSGLFEVVAVEKHGFIHEQMRWTPKGLAWAREEFGESAA